MVTGCAYEAFLLFGTIGKSAFFSDVSVDVAASVVCLYSAIYLSFAFFAPSKGVSLVIV